ncbi:MAG: hypothetical protein IJP69_04565 [Synergistaceae bacterium]|nr:hypothetical protein [Synergistaceae bacterium]
MNRLRVIGTDIGANECIPYVEIVNENDEVIGTAWGEKNAYLFAEAEEAYELLKRFVAGENVNGNAQELIDRVENSPELTCDGLTMQDILINIVQRGHCDDHK